MNSASVFFFCPPVFRKIGHNVVHYVSIVTFAMTSYSRQKNYRNFSFRLHLDLDEKFHDYVERSGRNRNALINEMVEQFLEEQPNKEPSEIYTTSEGFGFCKA